MTSCLSNAMLPCCHASVLQERETNSERMPLFRLEPPEPAEEEEEEEEEAAE